MARNLLGEIPDDHFENEPTYPAKNVSPLSQDWLDHIAGVKAERDAMNGTDKYKAGDWVGGF